jgi:archaellum component FlaC
MEIRDLTIGSLRKQLQEIEQRVESVKDYIKGMMELGEFVSEDMNNVADLLDITLTKIYDVTITVEYRGTIEIPMDEDIDNFENHISFEFSAPFSDEWNVDIYENETDIKYEEA